MANIKGTVQDATADDTDELLVRATNMNIKQYVEPPKVGKYDDEVQTLLAVDEQTGFTNSIEILVPSESDVKKYKRWFNDSAANFDKGARIVNGESGVSQGDGGGVLLEFVLTEKRHVRTKEEREADKVAKAQDTDAPEAA